MIALSFLAHFSFREVPVLTGDAEHFASLVVFLLPILLISDSLELKVADLREHGLSLLYLAVVAVILSVLTALVVSSWLFAGDHPVCRGGRRAVCYGAGDRPGFRGQHIRAGLNCPIG